MMEVITSNKGGQKLILNGFIYTKQITKPRNIRWRCVQRTTDCKATLTTTLDLDDPKLVTAHNHDPSDTKVAAVKYRSEMKQQAKQSFDKPSQIMTQAMSQIDVAARVDLGREESIKRTLRNQRLGRIPPQPESLQDLVIDGEWALTTGPDPQQFLVYDNGPDTDSRIIVFGASDALQHLSRADTWFMDGNHAVAPPGFCQLYVIRCPLGNTAVSTLSYVWTDEMGTKLLKNSFEELVTTSAGNLMVTKMGNCNT